MKLRYNFIVLALLLAFSACNDGIDLPEPVNDDAVIEQYIADNNLNANKSDEWDVYYVELAAGTGSQVKRDSVVEIEYENALLDGQVISSDTSYTFVPEVYAFIPGMQRGVLTMQEGGKSLVFIPSKYAYGGASGTLNGVFVPANAVLQSTITVKDVRTRNEQLLLEVDNIERYIEEKGYADASGNQNGLFKQILSEGQGDATPQAGARIVVRYEGSFLDGTVFDSAEDAQFNLTANGLIKGFYDGALTMKRDEEAVFIMVSDLGYKDTGTGSIPPFTPLVFKIKMLDF